MLSSYCEWDVHAVLLHRPALLFAAIASNDGASPGARHQPTRAGNSCRRQTSHDRFRAENGIPWSTRCTYRTVSSSSDAKVGDTLDFEVLEEVRVDGVLLVPKGGIAWATVTEAQSKRRMGRGGKLDINIDSVRLVDGEKVPLRAVKDMQGGGHVGAMTGAIVATSLVFFPGSSLLPLHARGRTSAFPRGPR